MSCVAMARGFCFNGFAKTSAKFVAKSPWSADFGLSSKMATCSSGAIVFAALASNWVRCVFTIIALNAKSAILTYCRYFFLKQLFSTLY